MNKLPSKAKYVIIGAGSVVNSEVAPNAIFAGNPAKFKKNIE